MNPAIQVSEYRIKEIHFGRLTIKLIKKANNNHINMALYRMVLIVHKHVRLEWKFPPQYCPIGAYTDNVFLSWADFNSHDVTTVAYSKMSNLTLVVFPNLKTRGYH